MAGIRYCSNDPWYIGAPPEGVLLSRPCSWNIAPGWRPLGPPVCVGGGPAADALLDHGEAAGEEHGALQPLPGQTQIIQEPQSLEPLDMTQ